MFFLKIYKSRRYLSQILISFTALSVLVISLMSTLLIYNAQKNSLNMLDNANRKVLTQLSYSTDYMHQLFVQLLMSLYFNNDVNLLMTRDDLELFDMLAVAHKLDYYAESTNYLDSIIVYNGKTDSFYSGGNARLRDTESKMTETFRNLLDGNQHVPKLRLIPQQFTDKNLPVYVFSLVMYDSADGYHKNENALIINIKADWLFNNLIDLNQAGQSDQSSIYILDPDKFIYDPSPGSQASKDIAASIYPSIDADKNSSGSSIIKIQGEKYVMTHLKLTSLNWELATIQPYREVIINIEKLRNSSILLTIIFICISIVSVFFVSHRLYQPVEILMEQIQKHRRSDTSGYKDNQDKLELTYISDTYGSVMKRLESLTEDYHYKHNIAKNYYLQRIVQEKPFQNLAEFQDLIVEHQLSINKQGPYRLSILLIDNESQLQNYSEKERKLILFAVANVMQELVIRYAQLEIINMRNEQLVLLFSPLPHDQVIQDNWILALQDTQRVIMNFYKSSLSFVVSEAIASYDEISQQYDILLQNAKYRMIFGSQSIITSKMIAEHSMQNEPDSLDEPKKRLMDGIRSGQMERCKNDLVHYFQLIRQHDADSISYLLLHLLMDLKYTIRDLNNKRLHSISVNLEPITRMILKLEALDDIQIEMEQIIDAIINVPQTNNEDKKIALLETVKEIIHQQFVDPNLSLQAVADKLKLSPAYLGRTFKTNELISIGDYINEIRLEASMELLNDHNLTIKEIMEKCGFSSQSNFFRLFKNKFGVPPKEFLRTKAIKEI
jgi:AraC-like DNA-binding protein